MADRLREPFPGTVDHIFPLGLAPSLRRDGFCVVHVEDEEGREVVGYRVAEMPAKAPFGVVFPDASSAIDLAGQLNAGLAIEGEPAPIPTPVVDLPRLAALAGEAGAVGVYARGMSGKGDEDEDEEGHKVDVDAPAGTFDDTDAALAVSDALTLDDAPLSFDTMPTHYLCTFLAEAVETGLDVIAAGLAAHLAARARANHERAMPPIGGRA